MNYKIKQTDIKSKQSEGKKPCGNIIRWSSDFFALIRLQIESRNEIYEKVRKHKICTYFLEIKFKMAKDSKVIDGCISRKEDFQIQSKLKIHKLK